MCASLSGIACFPLSSPHFLTSHFSPSYSLQYRGSLHPGLRRCCINVSQWPAIRGYNPLLHRISILCPIASTFSTADLNAINWYLALSIFDRCSYVILALLLACCMFCNLSWYFVVHTLCRTLIFWRYILFLWDIYFMWSRLFCRCLLTLV